MLLQVAEIWVEEGIDNCLPFTHVWGPWGQERMTLAAGQPAGDIVAPRAKQHRSNTYINTALVLPTLTSKHKDHSQLCPGSLVSHLAPLKLLCSFPC